MATIKKKMQAGGISKKSPKAPMVDPQGAWTKVQERTLGSMKKGGKIKKAQGGGKIPFGVSKKKVEKAEKEGNPSNPRLKGTYSTPSKSGPQLRFSSSTDTTGYAAGKKVFPSTVTAERSGKTYRTITGRKDVESTLKNPNRVGMKKGGTVAKDGKWIQKAINPKHKGYCTPMTKATCTPKRKALAMTLKKMAKKK